MAWPSLEDASGKVRKGPAHAKADEFGGRLRTLGAPGRESLAPDQWLSSADSVRVIQIKP
jgi:hypothetical protein